MPLPKSKLVRFLNFLPFVLSFFLSAFLIYKFSQFPVKEIFGTEYGSTPPPPGASQPPPGGGGCGDGYCDLGEASSCPQDCAGQGTATRCDIGGETWYCDSEDCGGSGGTYACWPEDGDGGGGFCEDSNDCVGFTCDCPQSTHDCEVACGAGGCYSVCGGDGGDDDDGGSGSGCTDLPPDRPVLSSPSNGSIIPLSSSVVLTWNEVSTWGVNCSGMDNHYGIYIGLTAGPGTLICWNNPGQLSCPITFDLENETTYYWMVRATNGAESNSSPVWSFTMRTDAWYQTQGGDIHADGGSITSVIPAPCSPPACNPYLMLNETISGQSGMASWQTGSLELGDDYSENVSEDGNNWRAMVGSYSGIEYDYDFWQYQLGDEEDIETLSPSTAIPNPDPGETKIYEYTEGNLDLTGGTVADGSKVIILHEGGDLTIAGDITVSEGSFLMVVTSGNMSIADDVSLVEGIYLADGTISFGSEDNDQDLTVEGSLIGWTNINLSARDFNDVRNDTQPILTFIYRPDLIIEAPDVIRRPQYHWQEIAP